MTAQRLYRVHVHDHGDQGRWLAQADYARQPTREMIEALPVLHEPGRRFEVRVCLVRGEDEYRLYGWLQDGIAEPDAVAAKADGISPDQFAAIVLEQTKARIAAHYSQWQADAEQVQVIEGPKYTKVDLGTEGGGFSGKYMIENATGIIYGIKGYGRVHKGHRYGTLATVDEWYWGGYVGEKRN